MQRFQKAGEWGPWWCLTDRCSERQREWALAVKQGKSLRYLFCPVPKQVEFFEATRKASRVLFGGAAGPGKSHAIRWGLYRDCLRIPNLNCLLLRRTYKELDKTHLREMAREVPALGGRYVASEKRAVFENGSIIEAGHCETDVDAAAYLSAEYDREAFDELVTFMQDAALEIMSRARTSKPQVIAEGGASVWAGSNPGGRGALWVKSFFVDRVVDPEEFPNYNPERYAYVHANLYDNPYLDPAYRQTLEEMPETRRRQLLYGDWLAFSGKFFDFWPFKESKDGPKPWHVSDAGLVA